MKKKGIKILACAVTMAMVLSLGACGGSDDSDSSTKSDNKTTQSTSNDSKDNDSTSSSNKLYDSMEEYVASDEVQEALDILEQSMEGTGMKIEVLGEDDKIIYRYTYDELVKEEGMEEQLKSSLEAQASTFEATAADIKNYVDIDNPIVVVEYIDANGETIYSQEFTDAD